MTILYLLDPGSTLGVSSECLEVRRGREVRHRLPAPAIERVAVLAPAHLTSPALALCAREGVELVVATRGARVLCRLGGSDAGLALRGAQHRAAADVGFRFRLARALVRAKVRNQRRLLGRSRGGRDAALVDARRRLGEVLEALERAESLPAVRGLEGRAAAAHFRGLRALLNPEYGFRRRSRRPPRDPANALLGFAYMLLTAEAAAAVAAAGLEPALGLYHDAWRGRPALALDLVEEFRAPVADALVLNLTGRRMVRPGQFREGARGVRMSAAARRRAVAGYESKLARPFRGADGGTTTLRDAIRRQAGRLAGAILAGGPYDGFELP